MLPHIHSERKHCIDLNRTSCVLFRSLSCSNKFTTLTWRSWTTHKLRSRNAEFDPWHERDTHDQMIFQVRVSYLLKSSEVSLLVSREEKWIELGEENHCAASTQQLLPKVSSRVYLLVLFPLLSRRRISWKASPLKKRKEKGADRSFLRFSVPRYVTVWWIVSGVYWSKDETERV